jgi:nucleoid DNA-binding protein
MGEQMQRVPARIRPHLEKITRTSGLPDSEESREIMARVWLEKLRMFEQQLRALDMQEVAALEPDDPRGALLLTYSASLISLSPLQRASRRMEYASIQLRRDVPNLAIVERAAVQGALAVDRPAAFASGAVRATSAVLKIAVCAPEVSLEEQERRIREATIFLTNGFVKINRTVLPPAEPGPEQFTMRSIVAYLAQRNGLTRKAARRILDDYLFMLESGMMLGERVPLGKIGRLYLKRRPPQKARVGINPATGQKATYPAKPEMAVPRVSFSSSLKRRAGQLDPGLLD